MSEWQPIWSAPNDRDFIAYIKNGVITCARFHNGTFFMADHLGTGDTDPSHWMPLPEPPK